jgi:hypothetical protein
MIIKIINILTILLFSQGLALANNTNIKERLITESRTYYKTKKTWQNTYNTLIKNGESIKGATFIAPIKGNGYNDRLHRNGARNTIIFVPVTTNFNKPVDIIFYFHGLGGFKERDFKTRVLKHTKNLREEGKNFIIVVPEMPWSKNTSTARSRQGKVFTKKDQFPTFVNSVVKIVVGLFDPSPVKQEKCKMYNICHFNFGNAILIGHSAGGSTLMSISKSGGLDWLYEKRNAQSVKIIFSDAGYGRWTDITWKNFKLKGLDTNTKFILLTRKWDRPHRNTKRFLKRFKTAPLNIVHKVFDRKTTSHSGIGDQAFTWAYYTEDSGCGENGRETDY